MSEPTQAPSREQRLDDVIALYLQAEKEGRAPSLEELLAKNPDLAAELSEFFADRASMQRLAAPVRAALTGLASGTAVRYFGDYEILGEIARGGMGVVYRARQVSLNRPVALKMILAGQLASPADVARFQSEAEAAASLDHPNIVPIHEIGAHQDQHYFSMKLVEGGSLAQWLGDCRTRMTELGRQDQADIAHLMETVARAIHFGHQRGILHRDLKPANILLQVPQKSTLADLKSAVPVVTDFGLAKRIAGGSDLTASGAIVGTPSYMAPEQAAGHKVLSTAADVYSLGAILYELVTGRPPFRAETPLETLIEVREREVRPPRALHPCLDRDLETICLVCLEKEPSRRYSSAEALADDLQRWLAGEPIQARPSTFWERTVKWARRRPAQAALVAVTAAAVLALLVGGSVFNAQLQGALANVRDKETELDRANNKVRLQEDAARAANQLASQHELTARKANDAAKRFEGAARQSALLAAERAVRAEGTLLTAHSAAIRPANPGLALLLAVEGARRAPGFLANNALLAALDECAEVRTFLGHSGSVDSAVFSPDGRRVLSCSEDRTARLWDVQTGKEVCALPRHLARVVIAQFSPDGRFLLTIAAEHYRNEPGGIFSGSNTSNGIKACLWSAANGKLIAHWRPGKGREHCSLTSPFAVGFSPDSRRVVSAFGHFPECYAYVHDTATGKQVLILKGHEQPVVSGMFSPDSKKIVTASLDESARIWDAHSGALLHMLTGHNGAVRSAAFSPDGKLIVTTGTGSKYRFYTSGSGGGSSGGSNSSTMENAAARVWNADTGKEVAVLRWPGYLKAFVRTAVFSPDGRRVLTAGNVGSSIGDQDDIQLNYRPNIWDAATGKLLVTLKGESRAVFTAVFSPDGRYVATAGSDKTARIWDSASGAELLALRGHDGALRSVCFSPDGSRLVTASEDKTARVWDVRMGQWPGRGKQEWLAIWPGSFTPDGKRLYLPAPTPGHEFTARVVDTATGKELARANGVKWHTRAGARFSPDGRMLITANWQDSAVHILDTATLKELRRLGGHAKNNNTGVAPAPLQLTMNESKISDMSFSPDGLKVVAADGTGRIWDAASGKLLRVLDGGNDHPIYAITFSRDSRRLVTLSAGAGHSADPGPMAEGTTLDGKRVLMPNPKCTARIWDSASGKQISVLAGHAGQVHVAGFSPDAQRLVTASHDNTVRLWDVISGKQLWLLKGHRGRADCAVFSPDGKMVLTGAEDKTARLWDALTGKQQFVLVGHDGPVRSAAFSPDGKLVLTCSEDGTARLWNTHNGREFSLLKDPAASVVAVAFSSDGQNVLATLRGETKRARRSSARIWPVDPLAAASARRPRDLTAAECSRFDINSPVEP